MLKIKNTVIIKIIRLNVLLLLYFGFTQSSIGQGRIVDAETLEALPFSAVMNLSKPEIMTISDINGYFTLPTKSIGDSILIRYVGYDTIRTIFTKDSVVYRLTASQNEIKEAVITADDGPAIAVIKKVLKNRPNLSIVDIDFYQCRIYTKNIVGFNTNDDSISIKGLSATKKYPSTFFIAESLVERQYEKRDKVFERVIASSAAGLKDAEFAIMPEDVQSLNFYRDYLNIYNKDYINPISPLSWYKYHFNLDKVYEENGDTLYKIDYWPKSNRFNCFKGMMVISDKGWAVQKIRIENASNEIYPFILQQEYKTVAGQWFPLKFTANLLFPSAVDKDIPFKITQTSIFDNVSFEPKALNSNKSNKTIFDPNAGHNLDSLRFIPLEKTDSSAYIFGNYIYDETPIGYVLKNMNFFINYQIPVGPVAIEAFSLYRRNLFEENRFGLSLLTNMNMMPHLQFGAYGAYGSSDKEFKYGGSVAWHFDKLQTNSVKYSYQNDIESNHLFRFRNVWFDRYYSNLYNKIENHELSYRSYPIININLNAGFKGLLNGEFEYQSLEVNINKVFRWTLIGNTNFTAQAGYMLGQPPIWKLFNAPASRTGSFTIQAPNSFQTMPANVFWSNKFAHLFVEQTIGKLFVTKFSMPELFLAYNAGWGKLDKANNHEGIVLRDYSNGFHEIGAGFNSLIRIPIYDWFAFGINVGGYYDLTSRAPLNLGENFVVKVGFGFLY
ncbi:MAG: hypothetical protein IPL13_03795 [Saprospiraceae bacterium]|nr:hypothetical protein [Candidatus Brachybacter algidus]